MCETTKAIEKCPHTQRKIIDISRICQRIVKAIRGHNDDEEDPNGMARRHA